MPGLFDDATDPYTQPQQQPDPSSLLGWLHSMLGNAGQQQQAEAGASQAMQPAVTGYLGDVASGQMAARAIPQDHYDPNRSLAQNALDPQALEQAQNIAMGFSGGGLGIKAYHGSPHDFDAFDASKIGTGEGVQAYGHGLYFAENEGVARSYRDALSTPLMDPVYNVKDLVLNKGWAPQQVIDHFNMMINTGRTPQHEQFYRDAIEAANSGTWKDYTPSKGHMYEVDINADPQQFLNWDKPASQWANAPLNAVQDLAATHGMRLGDVTGARLYDQLASNLSGVSGYGRHTGGDTQAASDALLKQGIPGIRYLDQGSRGGAGQGTSNYVVFDPKIIDILRKYAVPGLISGGAAAGATSTGSP
jgi:hypothetical protein